MAYLGDGSVPDDKDALVSEDLLGLDDVLSEVLSIMRYLGPHVVHHEWLCKVVLVVRVGHCFEVQSHHRSTLDVSKLVATCCCVAVSVEEPRCVRSVLWEVWVVQAALPLLVKVHDVVGLWAEKLSELLVLKHLI